MNDHTPPKSLMRSLGAFVGHIVRGVKSDPSPAKREVRRTIEEVSRPDGVVLRRTTIDEVEVEQRTQDRPKGTKQG